MFRGYSWLALAQAAESALEFNYAPHTGKHVVAAVVTNMGGVFGGTNIEGRSRTTKHAEEVAILHAITRGTGPAGKWLRGVYIAGAFPCGACRQFMLEFGDGDTPIYIEDYGETTLG